MQYVNLFIMNYLKNKKILLLAPELENNEHRGIAAYTKALIESLSDSGAEIWLTTSSNLKELKMRRLKESTKNYIYTTYILKNFFYGTIDIDKANARYPLFRPLDNLIRKITDFIDEFAKFSKFIFSSNTYNERNSIKVRFLNKDDNPYLRVEKLSFMKNISGFVCLPNFGFLSDFISVLPVRQTIKVNLKSFDIFISSAPLNLVSNQNIPIIQTIHDLIPLEYDPNVLAVRSFYKKLKFCRTTKNIFISKITQYKFNNLFKSPDNKFKCDTSSTVIVQPPSLFFDYKNIDIYNKMLRQITDKPKQKTYSKAEIKIWGKNKIKQKMKPKSLKPFNYFLFNASIDLRKNVLLTIESFINSDAQKKGYFLIITGKLKDDNYSQEIKRLIEKNKGIITTGFVNESLKAALYLNALCLLSPTFIEGFGIPVLDACCLGLKCFASDCNSHKEIKELYDFSNFLEIYPPKSITKWSRIFNDQSLLDISESDKIVTDRINRYEKFNIAIKDKFKLELSDLINNN